MYPKATMDPTPGQSYSLVDYIGYVVGAVGAILSTVLGLAFRQYTKFEGRLGEVETSVEKLADKATVNAEHQREIIVKLERMDVAREDNRIAIARIESSLVSLHGALHGGGCPLVPQGLQERR